MNNHHGVDTHYFGEKLGQLLRDLERYTPDELARALLRLGCTSCPSVLAEREFADQVGQELQATTLTHNDKARLRLRLESAILEISSGDDMSPGDAQLYAYGYLEALHEAHAISEVEHSVYSERIARLELEANELAGRAVLQAPAPAAEHLDGTTSDKYRAELYDEEGGKA